MRRFLKKLPDKLTFNLPHQEVHVRIMPLANIRRTTLRYDLQTQEFKLRTPLYYKLAAVEKFLREAQGWMEGQLSKAPQLVHIHECKKILLMGNDLELSYHVSRRVSFLLEEAKLHIMAPTPHFGALLEKWLRQMILAYCEDKSAYYSELLGVKVKKVSVRETRSRWGSCSAQGALSYNWRLIFAPKDVIDYVVAHEVAHLREMNHSIKFWRLVAQLHPEAQRARHWLKINGSTLFMLQFRSAS